MIAALFVETNGPYFNHQKIIPYDKLKDARTFDLSIPVIAHPPCQLWGKMAIINYKRWGGDHNKPGNDGGNFKFALDQVNRCGGVLEHPAQSYAWDRYGLVKPSFGVWIESGCGWVTEVWQCDYGHKARKATWLYYNGRKKPFDLIWRRGPYSHQIGRQDQRGKAKNKPTVTKREAILTPEQFKIELMNLAQYSQLPA